MFNLLFLAVFIPAFCLFYRILSPFLTTLAWAAITMTIIVILVTILLSGFFLNLIAKELADVYNYCEQLITEGRHLALREGLKKRAWA